MATDVVMPQMGESIAEGTIVRWIKKVGDKVDRDEPLFEISTDKVDAEIPSPAAGVVSEIRVKEGETVAVNSIVAVIGGATASAAPPPKSDAAATRPAAAPPPSHYHDRDDHVAPAETETTLPEAAAGEPESPAGKMTPAAATPAASASAPRNGEGASARHAPSNGSTEDAIRERSSPLVRKIAKEHNVDIAQIHGTGIAGRVTKDDILGFIDKAPSASASAPAPASAPALSSAAARPAGGGSAAPAMSAGRSVSGAPPVAQVTFQPGAADHVEKMSV